MALEVGSPPAPLDKGGVDPSEVPLDKGETEPSKAL